MGNEKLIRDMRALVIGFCSGVPTGLLLILALNMSLDSVDKPSYALFSEKTSSSAIEYDQTEELVLLREMLANLSNKVSVPSARAAGPVPDAAEEREVVLREWQLPAVMNMREGEDRGETLFGEIPRRLTPLGTGAFLFVQFGAYRSSSSSFGVVGLGVKSMQISWNSPQFDCAWQKAAGDVVAGNATKYLVPDIIFRSQYVAVVVHCIFDEDVGSDGTGGMLRMVANHGDLDRTGLEDVSFVAFTENPKEYDASVFQAPYKYEYLYCGSPLFSENGAKLSPQRMREWISYHMQFFGPNSHFILYDAGGIDEEVHEILDPWLKLGRITIMNIRQQGRYDTAMRTQFLVLNDCMYRAKSLAKWSFFFDIDEYMHFEKREGKVSGTGGDAGLQQPDFQSFEDLMSYLGKLGRKATSVTFQQRPMDDTHCVASGHDAAKLER